VKIRVEDVKESGRSLEFPEGVEELNELLAHSKPVDYQFAGEASVRVSYYRLGEDLFFDGHVVTTVSGTCGRCLESYPFEIDRPFSFLLKPAREGATPAAIAQQEDRSLGFYVGDEVDLSPLLREEMMLSLPTRPLCRDDCPGLCPQCGRNRSTGSCECADEWLDPRLAPLRALKLRSR
jgi:uncharacterized protein